ncbi:MAG: double zinc ribbon domain-containing protein [Candidatus Saccharibacteria bacterium]
MIDKLLKIIAPHYCLGCDKTGTLLCDNCKYNISFDPYERCLGCGLPAGASGVCGTCQLPYSKAWCVGERRDELKELIKTYKFGRAKSAGYVLGDLLLEKLPELPPHTVVVPIPTIAKHVRQRGHDHARLIAGHIAKKKSLKLEHALFRITNTTQRGASSAQRAKQAKEAFQLSGSILPDVPYLIVDDVVTTGATIRYGAQCLKDAGVSDVWVAAIARNPLD